MIELVITTARALASSSMVKKVATTMVLVVVSELCRIRSRQMLYEYQSNKTIKGKALKEVNGS